MDQSGLVGLVRDYLSAHRSLRDLFVRYRCGGLSFQDVSSLVGDTDESVLLFRLKERCHHLFRPDDEDGGAVRMRREALFDLAIGSLFHEAMKFRESFYQQEVYGPKVRELRAQAGAEADGFFVEFEKILSGAAERIEESLEETEALLALTADQLRVLLAGTGNGGLVTRFLIEERPAVEDVFPDGLDALLAEIHGDARAGWMVAANSYLESAHFGRAIDAIAEVRRRDGPRAELDRLRAYAEGMQAFMAGEYGNSLDRLEAWVDAGPGPGEGRLASLVQTAISRIDSLVRGETAAELVSRAKALAQRLEPLVERPPVFADARLR